MLRHRKCKSQIKPGLMRVWKLLAAGAPYGIRLSLAPNARSNTVISQPRRRVLTMRSNDGAETRRAKERFVYAYCHGFLSSAGSVKGQALRESLSAVGIDMVLLNLNGPDGDPGAITCSGALHAVKQFHLESKASLGIPDLKLRLAGSSLGGFITARYAALYPDEVDRIFMMCPAFCLKSRVTKLAPEAEMTEWERTRSRVFPLSTGGEVAVSWDFVEEAKVQPDYPSYDCPALIIHGLEDEVVPAATTRFFVDGSSSTSKCSSAIFVHDDHALVQPSTMSLTAKTLKDFFGTTSERDEVGSASEEEGPEEKLPRPRRDVEVESKFFAEKVDEVKASILEAGGQLLCEQMFWDVYWDTPNCRLTEKDWWIRSRAGLWELKIPAGDAGDGVTAYREVTRPREIASKLASAGVLFAPDDAEPVDKIDEDTLTKAGFEPFAEFGTTRAKYRLHDHGIDIDSASFGHTVVEIESTSSGDPADIASAGKRVAATAQSLGLRRKDASGQSVKGKLMEYIIRNCPKHLDALKR